MAEFFLKNDDLAVKISQHGAEIRSVIDNETGREYMWQADPTYWGWTSPVLFPIVGNVADDMFRYAGKTYGMKQHGFARRSEFEEASVEGADIGFALCDSEETLAVYPFKFRLEVGYALSGRTLKVIRLPRAAGTKRMSAISVLIRRRLLTYRSRTSCSAVLRMRSGHMSWTTACLRSRTICSTLTH